MNPFDDPDDRFTVLINDEEQHSLWPVRLAVPAGWRIIHAEGSRQECLHFIEEHWTDVRPLSAR